MKMKKTLVIVMLICIGWYNKSSGHVLDTSFKQPVSVKYESSDEVKGNDLKKLVIDYNDRIYVLTDKGLCRVTGKMLGRDLLYRPLADKIPVDITIQEGTGYMYYLFKSSFLSNANAGIPYGALPDGRFDQIAVASNGDVLLVGKEAAGLFSHGKLRTLERPADKIMAIQSFKDAFYALTPGAVYRLEGARFIRICQGNSLKTFAFRNHEMVLGTTEGFYGLDLSTGDTSMSFQSKIPIRDVEHLMVVNGKIWAGTPQGVFMQKSSGGFRYYASKRWLNEDHVTGMASDSKGNIYVLTPSGLNEIKFIRQTYLRKAKYFQRVIRERHIRYGLLAEIRMKIPGDLSTAEMTDTDNDGLWTSFYLGSQAFRYAVTDDPIARQYAWESFAAYERLLSINQLKGFPSRTFERKGYKVSDPSAWRPSPDSGWEWKGTTSSDEFVGYIFVAALMDEFVAKTKEEKKRIADFIDKILTHIIDNNYNFVDLDGKPTLWGRWNPDYVNGYAKTISDRKLASTDLIAGLELGYALTGKALYKKEAFRLMDEQGYLENIMISPYNIKATPGYNYKGHDMGKGPWNHSDDEMEFLSFWVLYRYAFNDSLKQKFAHAINEYWEIEKPERNPLWNLITLGTAGNFDRESTLWYLREFPMDRIRWTIKNSIRKDLVFLKPNFRRQYTKEVLSPEEMPAHRYNANEFELDGGNGGRTALTGAEYLLPYWMARYFQIIKE